MKIATFNINGINGRLPVLKKWLQMAGPDIVCLQELKAVQEKFPEKELERLGYGAVWSGQKSWNGVAILSKGIPMQVLRTKLPGGRGDTHSRYLEVIAGQMVIGCIYLPNGNPAPGEKFDYKMKWFGRLKKHAKYLMSENIPVVLAGDYNVIPEEPDVYKPEHWRKNALFMPEPRRAYKSLISQGWTDALRYLYPDRRIYTFWDYLYKAYERDAGLRLDHFLLSPQLVKRLSAGGVDKRVRGWDKASDHAPAWIKLND
ncbi:exodeoxyribonuclease III [Niabella beijingensis]|uniref:exodeoxyribonuclease III n=1 Tax=Niabella beijingensis TaxID=2872700 RepID=UPI001CBFB260|nr:exodeoxyribonuclease III [Niabella beijingensis]MBZ4192175.1 exodeoxyribonuclease III [Niabella beijingensis]